MLSAIGAIGWVALGVAATLTAAYVAHRVGWLQIALMREAHALNMSKAAPQIGCDVQVEVKQVLPQGYNPHLFVSVEIYNEGELAIRDVRGEWTISDAPTSIPHIPLLKDFLGKCQRYSSIRQIDESANWPRQGVTFDLEVEFYYIIPGNGDRERYTAKYRYEGESRRTLRIESDRTAH
jgi:hypothetical protein